jgi:hypothetical protein
MIQKICTSEASVLTRATQHNSPEDVILNSYFSEKFKSYVELTGWAVYWKRNVSPVKYELGLYTPEEDNLHSHRRENLKSYITLTG